MFNLRHTLPLIVALICHNTYASEHALSATEQKIVHWIDNHNQDAIQLIEESVNINSGSLNREGVKAVADHLAKELDPIGVKTQWIALPEKMKRGGHLFAEHKGTQGKKVLLIGHLDTVFEKDDSFQTFKKEGDWATGPGVTDVKAGNVIIIQALKALHSVGALKNTQIKIAYSGDEESPGSPLAKTRAALIAAGKWADVSLEFEAGIQDEQAEWATISRRSHNSWCLEVTGKQGHSSRIFNENFGAGAIFEASRILHEFYQSVRGEEYLTFNAGTISGGTEVNASCDSANSTVFGKNNVIPNTVVVRGGLRTLTEQQRNNAMNAMQAIVKKHLPLTKATLHFSAGYPAMAPTEGNKALSGMLSSINESLGREVMPALNPLRRGASDVSFVAPYSDALAGLGAYGQHLHSPKENLDLRSVPLATKRAALLIYRLTR